MKKCTLFLKNASDSFVTFISHKGESITLVPREHFLTEIDFNKRVFYNDLVKKGVVVNVLSVSEDTTEAKDVSKVEEVKKEVEEVIEENKETTEEVKKEGFNYEYYNSMTKPQILNILDGLEIDYKPSMTKEKLIKLLEEHYD